MSPKIVKSNEGHIQRSTSDPKEENTEISGILSYKDFERSNLEEAVRQEMERKSILTVVQGETEEMLFVGDIETKGSTGEACNEEEEQELPPLVKYLLEHSEDLDEELKSMVQEEARHYGIVTNRNCY